MELNRKGEYNYDNKMIQRMILCYQVGKWVVSNFTKPIFWVENNFKSDAFKGQWKLKTPSSPTWGRKEEKPIKNGKSWIPQYVSPIHWFYKYI